MGVLGTKSVLLLSEIPHGPDLDSQEQKKSHLD